MSDLLNYELQAASSCIHLWWILHDSTADFPREGLSGWIHHDIAELQFTLSIIIHI